MIKEDRSLTEPVLREDGDVPGLGPAHAKEDVAPVLGLNHVGVMVVDLDAVVEWYESTLGFRVLDRWEDADAQMAWAHLDVGNGRIEFVARRGLQGHGAEIYGLHHIALEVGDCAAAVELVVRSGGQVVLGPSYFPRHNMDWAFVRDPFNTTLELLAYRKEAEARPAE